MNKLKNWVRSHQITAFFLVAFIISWGLGFSWSGVMKRNQALLLPLAFAAACGPGLAGIILSALINTQPRRGARKTFWIALLAAWVIAALVCLANSAFYEQFPLSPPVVVLFTISVVPVAFVIASAYSRIPTVRNYLASLVQPRGVWGWSLLGLVLFPVLLLGALSAISLLTGQPFPSQRFPALSLSLVGLVIVKFLYQFFFFNATGEEAGWRGFAMPRLQARTSPLITALVIAVFWAPWHFFLWQMEGRAVETLSFWGEMYLAHFLLSVLIVWVCNRAGGSILVAGITHASINTAQAFIPVSSWLLPAMAAAALAVILKGRMWEKLPRDHPAVYRELDKGRFEIGMRGETMEVSQI